MKTLLARAILRWYLPRFLRDNHPFHRLLGHGVELQLGRISDEAFRQELERFYEQLDPGAIKTEIDFSRKARELEQPGGYKVDIMSIDGSTSIAPQPSRLDFWGRRFGLLRHLGIRSDLLILRQGATIPPHGHTRVVSGFYVLEGQVAIRHYDRICEDGDRLLVRPVLDCELGPGGFTINSELHHNIHWLQGLSDRAFLFRVTVTDTPAQVFGGRAASNSRIYVDPTGEADASGLIRARYCSEEAARRLTMRSSVQA